MIGPYLVPARDALRHYWGTAMLLAGTAGGALATVLPITVLSSPADSAGSTRLTLPPVFSSNLGFHWSSNAITPAAAQQETTDFLFNLLFISALSVLILATLSILGIAAARAAARAPEISVRRAVGASRSGLFASAIIEGALLASAGGLIGMALGTIGIRAAAITWPGDILPGTQTVTLIVIAGLAGVILLGTLFQLFAAPARRIPEPSPKPLELYIPALQLGMGLTVLMGSAMVGRHAESLLQLERERVQGGQVFTFSLPDSPPALRAQRYEEILQLLDDEDALVSLGSPGALLSRGMVDAITTDCGFCPSGGIVIQWHVVFAAHHFVSADTFRAMGTALIAGRGITGEDRWDAPPVAVVSRGLAARHFERGNAVGRQLQLNLAGPRWYTVVGVVEDQVPVGLGQGLEPRPQVYISALQHPPATVELLTRSKTSPETRAAIGRALAAGASTTLAVTEVSERAYRDRSVAPLSWFASWFAIEGWGMLAITMAGAFVLMRLWVLSLFPELGVRRATGARRGDLIQFILARAALTGVAAVLIAIWFGPAVWDTLPEAIPGMAAWDVPTLAPLALLTVTAAMAGALFPALRAAGMSPARLVDHTGE